MQKTIIFLNRAYNDMDIQMPLVVDLAENTNYKIEIWGYPADGFVGNPHTHEAAAFASQKCGVSFRNACETPHTPPVIKWLYRLERFFEAAKKKSVLFKPVHILLLNLLKSRLLQPSPWLLAIAREWNAAAIIMDEAQVQTGRSYLNETVLPQLMREQGTKIYLIKTGHHVYLDYFPTGSAPPKYAHNGARYLLEPGIIDEQYSRDYMKQENIVRLGNLRMDAPWIERLHAEILKEPYYPLAKTSARLPEKGIKIVIMLAKMNYGVEADNLKNLIRALGAMEGVQLAIKPHTRGMKFDFMPESEIGSAVLVGDIPSAILCEWADMLLFTGSSIAFHSMVLGRSVGYLKFCQKLETFFDHDPGVHMIGSLEELLQILSSNIEQETKPAPHSQAEKFLEKHVYAGRPDRQSCKYYREFILTDLEEAQADHHQPLRAIT
jgi:hypothetical protein